MDMSIQEIAAAGRTEAERMLSAVAGRDEAAQVSMSASQFATLARLIDSMADRLGKPDPEAFGEARYWIPLDVFERKQRALQSLEQECVELRRQTAFHRPLSFDA